MALSVTKAVKADKKSIQRFYKAQQYSASFMGFDHCYLLKQQEEIIACVIISQITPSHKQFFLHALVVDKSHQKKGFASQLLQHVTKLHHPLVCFASNTLAALYESQGLQYLPKNLIASLLSETLVCRFKHYQKQQKSLAAFISSDCTPLT